MAVKDEIKEIQAVEEKEEEKEEEEEDIIPAKMLQNIQNKLIIQNIKYRMYKVKQCYFNPETLEIVGYNLLRGTPGQHWKSRIYTLFCDAYLPHFWIIDIWKHSANNTNDDEIPSVVYIQLISFRVKMFVQKSLTNFFKDQNKNINVYD
jgi:hypothetical protein